MSRKENRKDAGVTKVKGGYVVKGKTGAWEDRKPLKSKKKADKQAEAIHLHEEKGQ